MTEQEFLQSYDPAAFPRVAVAVDLVLLSIVDGQLVALLQQRAAHPGQGQWALPGSFVQPDEDLEQAAARVLAVKARMDRVWLEQLYTFGAPERDPRMRIVSVAYFALLPEKRMREAIDRAPDLGLAHVALANGTASATSTDLGQLPLAFDHADILAQALLRIRGKLDYAPIAFALLPRRFTLRQLQDVHEAILGQSLTKPAFRRRMRDQGWIEATGEFETGAPYRPAELYRFKQARGD